MSTGLVLFVLGIFYFLAHALAMFFQRTRVPDVLLLVLIGVLLGPIMGWTQAGDFGKAGQVLTVIALAVILFESGTTLKLSTMASSMTSTLALTLVTSLVSTAVIAIGTVGFFDGQWSLAILTGSMLCGTSSAVVIPMIRSLKVGENASTILTLESALTDVLCIIFPFALMNSLSSGDLSMGGLSREVLLSLSIAGVIGVAGGLMWLAVWNRVRTIPNSIFTTIAFAFVLYGFAEIFEFSGAIATLCFGVTLANLPLVFSDRQLPTISQLESGFYQEIVFLLKVFFFIFLGLSITMTDLGVISATVGLVAIVYFCRLWITRYTLTKHNVSVRDAGIVALMVPKGLSPAVVASLVVQKGIPGAETIQAIVFSMVFFSILFTAVLVPLIDGGPLTGIVGRVLGNFDKEIKAEVKPPLPETPASPLG